MFYLFFFNIVSDLKTNDLLFWFFAGRDEIVYVLKGKLYYKLKNDFFDKKYYLRYELLTDIIIDYVILEI